MSEEISPEPSTIRVGARVQRKGPPPIGTVLAIYGSGRFDDPVRAIIAYPDHLAVELVQRIETYDPPFPNVEELYGKP